MSITWIMQVYLGDYLNCPKDHSKKFKRAVKSFLAMKDDKSKLVIVSDGCHVAHEIYFKEFSKHKNIKYIFAEKTTPKMSDEWKGESMTSYHRAGPRRLGINLVETQLTTYLDSNDFLLPNAAEAIRSQWEVAKLRGKSIDWIINSRWYDLSIINDYLDNENYHKGIHNFDRIVPHNDPIKIKGLRGRWQEVGMKEHTKNLGAFSMNIIHKSNININWMDSVTGIPGGVSPAASFIKKLIKLPGVVMDIPYYVRCHHSNLWDQ